MGVVFCEESDQRASECRGCQEEEKRMAAARQQFGRIRERFLAIRKREDTYRQETLYVRYRDTRPPRSWLTKTEQDKLAGFDRAKNRESDKMFALLDQIAGRSFAHDVPWWWVMSELTFEDAVTKGELSVVPPAPLGRVRREVERFAQAVA